MKKTKLCLHSSVKFFLHFKPNRFYLPSISEFTTPLYSVRCFHSEKFLFLENFASLSNLQNGEEQTSLAAALSFSSREESPFLGTQIHGRIVKLGFSTDTFSQNNLLVMYSKCKLLGHGLKLFDEMTDRNLVSWTSIISGAIQNGEFEMGLELYVGMMRAGFRPNEFAFGSVLKACATLGAIRIGSSLHSISLKIGTEVNLFVGSSLLHMYAKVGDIGAAERLFECQSDCDIASWNTMVGGYAVNGYGYEGMKLVSLMHKKAFILDPFTFAGALKACSSDKILKFGQQVHGLAIHNEMEYSSLVMNSLISMYFTIGRHECALRVFTQMQQKDVITWNTMMVGFAQDEKVGEVVDLFSKMVLTCLRPNQVTFSIILRMCSSVDDLTLGLQFCSLSQRFGFLNHTLVANSLIDLFCRCAMVEDARIVFESLPTRPIISWNEMIAGYNMNNCSLDALTLFCIVHKLGIGANEFTYSSILGACCNTEHAETGKQIHASVIKSGFDSNCFVGSSLVNTYARFAKIDDLFKIFHSIKILDIASWGTMISSFSQQGYNFEALIFLNSLREADEKPDEFILGSALNACANLTAFKQSKCMHSYVIKTGYEGHLCVSSSMIDAYAKCGDIKSSKMMFDSLSRNEDPILFNTMITAYAKHGLLMETIKLFEKIKVDNIRPTHATFVSVISACAHLGLVDQGKKFFNSISLEHGLDPSKEIYGCFVDLLARNGLFEDVKDMIREMPFEPWPTLWRSILSACRIHGNRELGESAAKSLLQLEPNNDATYILLMKVYAEDGKFEDVQKVRMQMEERGIRKEAACSWIEI